MLASVKHPTGRRVRALRYLAGYDSLNDFAAALDYKRLSAANLRVIERGDRELEDHEKAHIAKVCQIDPVFFEIDLEHLAGAAAPRITPEQARDFLEQVVELADRARAQGAGEPPRGRGGKGRRGGAAGDGSG